MQVNKYPGTCGVCGKRVPARAGVLGKYRYGKRAVYHTDCASDLGLDDGLVVTTFSDGQTMTRNKKGRCEDAPCCGCCT